MPDRILTAELAAALQADCEAEGELLVWIVSGTEGEMVARPVTSGRGALPYVLTADTLAALRALLPAGLLRMDDGAALPDGAAEAWLRAEG